MRTYMFALINSKKLKLSALLSAIALSMTMVNTAPAFAADYDELTKIASTILRKSREITREAKIDSEWGVVREARKFTTASRLLYLQVDEEHEVEELIDTHDSMLPKLKKLERAIKRAEGFSGGDLTDLSKELKRSYFYFAEVLEDEPAGIDEEKILIKKATYFKASTSQSSSLSSSQKCFLEEGIELLAKKGSITRVGSHFKLTLNENIDGCSFGAEGQKGYLYGAHVAL